MADTQPRYRYETHMHTSEASACGRSGGAELAEMYARAGYAGIVVTDHFFNGNCAVPADLPWHERVERFCLGYERAAAAGRPLGLTVFLGWEYNYQGTEFLTYGLGKDFLLAHDDILQWDVIDYLDAVRAAGGFVSQAHPFRQREYIRYTRLLHKHVDAAEVHNACDQDAWNEMAERYAQVNDLAWTAGSDCHHVRWPQLSGLAFAQPLDSVEALVEALRSRSGRVLRGVENPSADVAEPSGPTTHSVAS